MDTSAVHLIHHFLLKSHCQTPLARDQLIARRFLEMIAVRCNSYTSLRDLMLDSPTQPEEEICGREIPIKDPLLQHEAWAYLRPMAAERGEDGRWWWGRFLGKCWGLLGCFNDVVLVVFGVGGW